MNGKLFQRSISKVFPNNSAAAAAEILLLMLAGMVAVLLHAKFRTPLRLPGHHGIEFMAIFIFTRMASRFGAASSIAAAAASVLLLFPVLGFKDPFMSGVFFICGASLDILFSVAGKSSRYILITALIAGLAYATIPLSRQIISLVSGFPYGSLMTGLFKPLALHFIFGFTGGIIGAGIHKLLPRK